MLKCRSSDAKIKIRISDTQTVINDVAVLFEIAVSVGALGPTADGIGVKTQNIVFHAFDVLPATVCPFA